MYDQDAAGGFPILSQLLGAARRGRGRARPGEWIDLREACADWWDATHPAAREALEDFDLGLPPAPPQQQQQQRQPAAATAAGGLTEAMLRLHVAGGGGGAGGGARDGGRPAEPTSEEDD